MSRIKAEFSSAKRTLPEFAEGVVRDPEAADRLRQFHVAAGDPSTSLLERDSLLTQALVWLVGRHGTARETLTGLGCEHRAVRKAREYLDEHANENISLAALARTAGLSSYHLCRVFHRDIGLTPHVYQEQARVRRAKRLLREGMTIATAAAEAGFFDQSHLSRHFKRIVGVTPGGYVRAETSP